MILTLAEVEHIAALARLELTAAEKEQYRQQLSAILDYAARLQELDTSGVLPTSSVLATSGLLREDEERASLPVAQVLSNTADKKNNQFLVPPVLE